MNLYNQIVSSVIKNYSLSQNAFLPKIVTIPLSQEYNLTYIPTVKIGDTVKEGEIIAKSTSEYGETTYIHSSIPGKVIDIEPCCSPNGKQEYAIKIQFGGSFSYLGKKNLDINPSTISPISISDILIEKGIINTFRTSFPENLGLKIKTMKKGSLIVRMFDEDPYRYADSLIAKIYFEQVIKGAKIVAKAMNASGIVIAIDQKLDEEAKKKCEELKSESFCVLEMNIKRYPCGTPREIVSAFNRNGMKKNCNFTINKNDLFTDASSMYEAYKAVLCSTPAVNKEIHFTGNCLFSSALLNVKIGTPLKDVISQLGGFVKEPATIIINGSLCGTSVTNLEVPVTQYVKSVEFSSIQKVTDDHIYSCVNCGNCRFVCPVKISPDILYNNTVNFKLLPETFAASSLGCIECGLCNTVCPSRLPLCQTIIVLKQNIKEN